MTDGTGALPGELTIPQQERVAAIVQKRINRLYKDFTGDPPDVSPGLVHLVIEATQEVLGERREPTA